MAVVGTPVVFKSTNSGATYTVSLGAIAAGRNVFVSLGNYPSQISSISLSSSGALTPMVQFIDDGINSAEIWYKLNVAGGTETLTITPGSASNNYISGTVIITDDASMAPGRKGTSNLAIMVTAEGPNAQPNALVLNFAVADDGTTNANFTTPSGYTLAGRENDSSSNYTGFQSAYKYVSAVETSSASMTALVSMDQVLATFYFTPSTTGSTATPAAGSATVSRTAGSRAAGSASSANGIAAASAVASSTARTTASAAVGVASVSGTASQVVSVGTTAASGTATVSAASTTFISRTATAANGLATVAASAAAIVISAAVAASGVATVSGIGGTAGSTQSANPVAANSLATTSAIGSANVSSSVTTANGVASASAIASQRNAGSATVSAGIATISATTTTLSDGASSASPANGIASVSALGSSLGRASGLSNGVATVSASSAVLGRADAVSIGGQSTVSATSAVFRASSGIAAGSAFSNAIGSARASTIPTPAAGFAVVSASTGTGPEEVSKYRVVYVMPESTNVYVTPQSRGVYVTPQRRNITVS